MMHQNHTNSALDVLGTITLLLVYLTGAIVLVGSFLKEAWKRSLAALWLGLYVRWWALSEATGESMSAVSQREVEAFTTALTDWILSLGPATALLVTQLFIVAVLVWQLERVKEPLVDFWYRTSSKGKVMVTVVVATGLYLQQNLDPAVVSGVVA